MDENEEVEFIDVRKAVRGALLNCIKAHGPITEDWLESATKRVAGELKDIIRKRVAYSIRHGEHQKKVK